MDAAFDDTEVALPIRLRHAGCFEPLLGQRQQHVEGQRRGVVVGAVEPRQVGAETLTGRRDEVRSRHLEGEHAVDLWVAGADRPHQAEPERRVGHLVDDRGARRQHPVLDAQVRLAVGDAVAAAVPAPHRSRVQAKRLQRRRAPLGKIEERIGVVIGSEHRAEAGDVLPVELADRRRHPVVPERDPSTALAKVMTGAAGVDGLLEQGDAGLRPQPLAEQQRRVGGAGEDGPGQQLGDVVEVDELVGPHLEVDLEAGVAGLGHHRVLAHAQLVGALDVQLVGLSAQVHRARC